MVIFYINDHFNISLIVAYATLVWQYIYIIHLKYITHDISPLHWKG